MTEPNLGKTIDQRYQILSEVGQDDLAVTYKVKHLLMDRVVMLKILKPEHAAKPDDVERFRKEADASSGSAGADDAILHDIGMTESGRPYFVTAIVEDPARAAASASSKAGAKSHQRLIILCVLAVLSGVAAICFYCADDIKIEILRTQIGFAELQMKPYDKRLLQPTEELLDLYVSKGRAADAVTQLKHVIEIRTATGPLNSTSTYKLQKQLADLYYQSGDRKKFKEENQKTIALALHAALDKRGQGDYAGAVPIYAEMVAMTRDPRAESESDCIEELTWLGETLMDAGRIDEAGKVIEESLALAARLLPVDSHRRVRNTIVSAKPYIYRGQYEKARPILMDAIKYLQNYQFEQVHEIVLAYTDMAVISYLENNEREAHEWLVKALDQETLKVVVEVRSTIKYFQGVFLTIGKKQEAEKLSGLLAMLKAELEKRSSGE